MSKQTIWNYFKRHTQLSDEAIAGIMGNMEAESNCEACRLQGDFTANRTTSKQYAREVDNGTKTLHTFMYDSKGWGLCQWTYYTRKENLYKTCQSYGTGIEDETTQIRFMLAEMQTEHFTKADEPSLWQQLLSCNNIYTAARLVCVNYERPAINNVAARADYGQTIYNQFHGKDIEPEPEPVPVPPDPDQDWILDWIEFNDEEIARLQAKNEELRGRLK